MLTELLLLGAAYLYFTKKPTAPTATTQVLPDDFNTALSPWSTATNPASVIRASSDPFISSRPVAPDLITPLPPQPAVTVQSSSGTTPRPATTPGGLPLSDPNKNYTTITGPEWNPNWTVPSEVANKTHDDVMKGPQPQTSYTDADVRMYVTDLVVNVAKESLDSVSTDTAFGIYNMLGYYNISPAQLDRAMNWPAGTTAAWTQQNVAPIQAAVAAKVAADNAAYDASQSTPAVSDADVAAYSSAHTAEEIYVAAKANNVSSEQLDRANGWEPGTAAAWIAAQGLAPL